MAGNINEVIRTVMLTGDKIICDQAYLFIVKAVNAAGEGPYSAPLRITATDPIRVISGKVPGVPELKIKSACSTTIEVEWKAP